MTCLILSLSAGRLRKRAQVPQTLVLVPVSGMQTELMKPPRRGLTEGSGIPDAVSQQQWPLTGHPGSLPFPPWLLAVWTHHRSDFFYPLCLCQCKSQLLPRRMGQYRQEYHPPLQGLAPRMVWRAQNIWGQGDEGSACTHPFLTVSLDQPPNILNLRWASEGGSFSFPLG